MSSERRTRWTDDHGADGLRDKFHVYSAKSIERTGRYAQYSMYQDRERLGATGEFVFVLRPEADKEAWRALAHYAVEVAHRAPQLADAITEQLGRIAGEQA